jgi:hypothetical protein
MQYVFEALLRLNYFKSREWVVLDSDKKIIFKSKARSKLQQSLSALPEHSFTWIGNWGFVGFDYQGEHFFMGLCESESKSEVALQIAISLFHEQQSPGRQQLFEQLIMGKRQWQLGDKEVLGIVESKHYTLIVASAVGLEGEAVKAVAREVFKTPLMAVVDQHLFVALDVQSGYAYAALFQQMILEELLIDTYVVYDLEVLHWSQLGHYASMMRRLLVVGRQLYATKHIFDIKHLHFAHSIDPNSHPTPLSVVKDQAIAHITKDPELMITVMHFFEYNLNVTDTANALFVHRNTLLYRLSKIEQLTGYDLRRFEDALNFYSILAKQLLV